MSDNYAIYKNLESINANIDEVLTQLRTDIAKLEMREDKIKYVEIDYVSLARHYMLRVVYNAPSMDETVHFVFFPEIHKVISNRELAMLVAQTSYTRRVFVDFVNKFVQVID